MEEGCCYLNANVHVRSLRRPGDALLTALLAVTVVQEPARASQSGYVLPREPVTRGVTPTHVLTRAHKDVVHNVKVVILGDVTRGLGEDLALVLLPPLTRVHIHTRGGPGHAGLAHLQRVAVPQQVAEGGGHRVLREM